MNTNSITECINQMVALTKKNLEILKMVNDSFHTKKNHISAIVGDEIFTIPSFLSLESRINTLEHNMENVVNAPLTGEAFTYHDGTTQRLELSGYSTTPNHVDLTKVSQFGANMNNIFKDFMTPNPYIRLNIASIPNNIKHVNIRKIAISETSTDLIQALQNVTTDGTIGYPDAEKILYGYTQDIDYVTYDTIRRLPIRTGLSFGEYTIKNILDNYQDDNFDEYYELEIDGDLVYFVNNGTIQKDIKVGDNLVTYNDKVMLEVMEINQVNKTMVVKVLYGAYADLQDVTSNNPALYKLKYYKNQANLDATKYIDVPIEEDRYVLFFVAPINDTTNTQSPWGTGLFMDMDSLTMDDPESTGTQITFRDYYNRYVNNVGDALVSITSMMNDDEQVSRLSGAEFDIIKSIQPVIDKDLIKVTQINKHLNDTKSIKTIRNLYAQKSQYKNELGVVQRSIDNINKDLAELSFDDSTNSRTVYETQLSEYNRKKSELIASIDQIIQEISVNANNSETPIENAKYRIRGFIPVDIQAINNTVPEYVKVIRLDVEYRYKNKTSFTGNAETFSDDYIFSDWNKLDTIYRKRVASRVNNGYTYQWEELNTDTNNPSFNQIDIPISQGEIVDIRVRFVYNLGYPFAETCSAWCPIYTQEFPVEFTKNVEVLDIISENNDDIKSKMFQNILEQSGTIEHINDQIQDQAITYKHDASHIASGFLTEERRVIPLSDKLFDINNTIEDIKSEVFGASSTNLIVTLGDINNTIQLKPNIINTFHALSYKKSIAGESALRITVDGTERDDDPLMAMAQLVLNIYNNGAYTMKLHSLFPGSYNNPISINSNSQFNASEYTEYSGPENDRGVFMLLDNTDNDELFMNQHYNQFMYFRRLLVDTTNTNQGKLYRSGNIETFVVPDDNIGTDGIPVNLLPNTKDNLIELQPGIIRTALMNPGTADSIRRAAFLYPYPGSISGICIPSDQSFLVLNPGESISIPINFVYWFNENGNAGMTNMSNMRNLTVSRAMAFDIRTSLFQDPITFKFVVDASFNDTLGFTMKRSNKISVGLNPMHSIIKRIDIATPQRVSQISSASVNNTPVYRVTKK